MTREEAVAVLKELMKNPLFSEVHKVAFNIAIHDIKQRHDWDINNLILINKDDYEPLEQEPKKGHWIEERDDYGEITHWHCSNCYDDSGFITTCKWDYCPNCGAKMESEDKV